MQSSLRYSVAALMFGAVLLPAAQVPRPAAELTFVEPGGKTVSLSKFKGQVVVVEIMSTTCPHCQNGAQILSRLKTELGPRGFQPLGVAINDNPDVPAFIKNYKVNFPVGTGKHSDALAFLEHSVMAPLYFPAVVFVDRKGIIRGQYGGTDDFVQNNEEANFRGMIQKLLAEPGSRPAAKAAKSRTK